MPENPGTSSCRLPEAIAGLGAIGIDGFTWQEDADQNWTWTISELLTSSELSAEGAAMRHCVASYAPLRARAEKLHLVDDLQPPSWAPAGPSPSR